MTSRRLLWVLPLALLGSCEHREVGADRVAFIHDVAVVVVLPGYRAFAAAATALRAAAEAFETTPDGTNLDLLQAAWLEARRAWGRCEAHFFGPEEASFLNVKIDTYPVLTPAIETIIAGAATLDATFVESLGSNRKGFQALDYLLFDPGGDAAVLDAMIVQPNADRRRALARAYSQNLEQVAAAVRDLWEPAGGNYVATLAAQPTQAALDDLINRLVAFAEFTADTRLGAPAGLTASSGGVPDPSKVESPRSDASIDDLLADLQGIRDVWTGDRLAVSGVGLRDLVYAANPVLVPEFDVDLQACFDRVQAIPGPLDVAVVSSIPSVEAAWRAVKRLHVRLAVDVVAALGNTLGFSPFDGD
jgi:predicted lipoprotein